MTDEVFIAIDQGGHATRASAYSATGDLEGAAFVSVATQRNALGHVEHDPEEIVASVGTALAELARIVAPQRWLARPRGPALEPRVLERGRWPALALISWQDTRNAAWLRASRRADDVARLTGCSCRRTMAQASCAGASITCRRSAARRRSRACARVRSRAISCTGCWRSALLRRRVGRRADAPVVALHARMVRGAP
jgi:hypothetical protein